MELRWNGSKNALKQRPQMLLMQLHARHLISNADFRDTEIPVEGQCCHAGNK
jgi:hypothetical protein